MKTETNWLITGGGGFIGLNLIRHLLEKGCHKIRVVDNFVTSNKVDLLKIQEIEETRGLNLSKKYN